MEARPGCAPCAGDDVWGVQYIVGTGDILTEHLAHTGDRKPIPSLQFSTGSIEAKKQFEVWRDFMAPTSDVEPLAPRGQGFRASTQAYDLGAFHLASFDMESATFHRTGHHARVSGTDHWCLTIVNRGNLKIVSDDGNLTAAAGDTILQTYGVPFSGLMEGAALSCLFLSRDRYSDVADELDRMIDQRVLGSMSTILRDFLVSIASHAHELSTADVPAVNEAFSRLLKAAFRPNADMLDAARSPIAATQFAMARRIINQHLKSPGLTQDAICRKMGISRRQLYYVFERHGGVMKYITQRRLAACHDALVAQTGNKRISSIAYEYGFTHLSSFYRQFQARYGFRPGEARSAWLDGHASRQMPGDTFADWLALTSGG